MTMRKADAIIRTILDDLRDTLPPPTEEIQAREIKDPRVSEAWSSFMGDLLSSFGESNK